ncbi:MAG: 50S ribosomal protein L9 [Muribaculaceae bacterium]|nr:50S ribosomal protein L9 [Bacteroides sp.]MDE6222326.1 50S ribosomal protein L9 [Muribaculaceae bacterium]MBD5325333.1 50S ribosomal protein L9 [Bacteroides sp.]MBD5326907.1 50S ribosomal protein L9 [Bacteroides sp.]MBD5415342.1 50S ribosomal protein L9 [Bacteroides sp.]
MKLILIEDVPNLGYKDDVVEVKAGYGRNYLIPQRKAVIATESALKVLAENQRQRAHKLAAIKAAAEQAAAALEGVALTIAAKVAETGTIYGAVNAASVAEALQKLGHEVDRKLISLNASIKEVGNYTATIRFHKDVTAQVPVEVVAEVAEA